MLLTQKFILYYVDSQFTYYFILRLLINKTFRSIVFEL